MRKERIDLEKLFVLRKELWAKKKEKGNQLISGEKWHASLKAHRQNERAKKCAHFVTQNEERIKVMLSLMNTHHI